MWLNKQGCGLARKGHEHAVEDVHLQQLPMLVTLPGQTTVP